MSGGYAGSCYGGSTASGRSSVASSASTLARRNAISPCGSVCGSSASCGSRRSQASSCSLRSMGSSRSPRQALVACGSGFKPPLKAKPLVTAPHLTAISQLRNGGTYNVMECKNYTVDIAPSRYGQCSPRVRSVQETFRRDVTWRPSSGQGFGESDGYDSDSDNESSYGGCLQPTSYYR